MNINGILHMTITPEGSLSVWETPADARANRGSSDEVVQIALTQYQMRSLLKAQQMAKTKREENQKRETRTQHTYISPSTEGY